MYESGPTLGDWKHFCFVNLLIYPNIKQKTL